MIELILLICSVLLIAICGIFVAAEFSLLAVNRSTVERYAARGDQKAKGIAGALRTLSSQLSGAQIGITVTNLAIGFLAEPAIAYYLESPLSALRIPEAAIPGIAIVLGVAIATAATMVFGELVPKNLAITKPMATARFIQRPQRVFTRVMHSPINVLNHSANALLRLVNVQPQEELASARSADELLSLVRRSAERGTLPKETAIMVERSLNFGDLTALDVMTPRLRVQTLTTEDPVWKVVETARKSGHSRFPVVVDSFDNVVGIAHIKQAITIPIEERGEVTVEKIMSKPTFVPSSIQLEALLEQLRQGGMQMAVVVDEFGGTDGIVTIEDLLEELVGEVQDEHDRIKTAIHKTKRGTWILSGLLRPDEIGEELGIFLPEEEEYETIGGLISHYLERMPEVHDSVTVPAVDRDGATCDTQLEVIRMDGHRIDKVQLTQVAAPEHNNEEEL